MKPKRVTDKEIQSRSNDFKVTFKKDLRPRIVYPIFELFNGFTFCSLEELEKHYQNELD